MLGVGRRRCDPGVFWRDTAVAPSLNEVAARFRLDGRELEVDAARDQDPIGSQEAALRIGQETQDVIVEAEVTDVVAQDDVGLAGQLEIVGVGLEEARAVAEARLGRGAACHLDDRTFVDEQHLARSGPQRHQAEEPAAAAEVEGHMVRPDEAVDGGLIAAQLHAVSQVAIVFAQGI